MKGTRWAHQGRDKGDVARQPVELGHNDRAALGAPCGQRCGELRPAIQGIGALAGFHLDEIGNGVKPSASAKRFTAAFWASMPRPERPCLAVETRW
jgi:hypothetical protein